MSSQSITALYLEQILTQNEQERRYTVLQCMCEEVPSVSESEDSVSG